MKNVILAASVILGLFPLAVRAEDPPPPADLEHNTLFVDLCVKTYPDEAALGRLVVTKGAQALSPEELKHYMHGPQDQGHGWYLKTALTRYVIILQQQPFRACTVRRMTPDGLHWAESFKNAVVATAKARGAKLVQGGKTDTKGAGGAVDISFFPYAIEDSAGNPLEVFVISLANYHGRPPDNQREWAAGGEGVDLSFIRRLVVP